MFFYWNDDKKVTPMKSKKNITFSDDEPCRNCGTRLETRYCPHCGQDRLMGRQRSFGQMAMDIGSSIFAFDDKSWSTIKKLIFNPGFLSKEYVTGRLIRYTMPFKMFWLMILAFTIVFSFHDTTPVILTPRDTAEERQTPTEIVRNEGDVAEQTAVTEAAEQAVVTEQETQNGVVSDFLQYLPYFMLLVIPVFTALLALFFRKEKYAFSEHLIFAVHLHTLIFFLFTLEILVASYLFDSEWTFFLFFLMVCVYSMFAFFTFYNTRKKRNILLRMFIIGLLYFIILIVLVIGVMLALLWIFNIQAIDVG